MSPNIRQWTGKPTFNVKGHNGTRIQTAVLLTRHSRQCPTVFSVLLLLRDVSFPSLHPTGLCTDLLTAGNTQEDLCFPNLTDNNRGKMEQEQKSKISYTKVELGLWKQILSDPVSVRSGKAERYVYACAYMCVSASACVCLHVCECKYMCVHVEVRCWWWMSSVMTLSIFSPCTTLSCSSWSWLTCLSLSPEYWD